MTSALAALEREARDNPDAADLLALIEVLPPSPCVRLDVSIRLRPITAGADERAAQGVERHIPRAAVAVALRRALRSLQIVAPDVARG